MKAIAPAEGINLGIHSIMEEKQRVKQLCMEDLRQKGIDIDKNATPEEARLIVYQIARELWGDDEALIKKNLRKVVDKAMKMFVTEKGDNVDRIDSDGLGRGQRKRKAKIAEDDHQEKEIVPAKKQNTIKKAKKPNNFNFWSPLEISPEPSPMPEVLRTAIERCAGVELSLVIQKALTESDVNQNLSRLLIPVKQVKAEFLIEREQEEIVKKQEKMKVKLVEPTGTVPEIILKLWVMKKSNNKSTSSYVLINTWNNVKNNNALHVKDVIQVWAFRTPERDLGIAISKLP